MQPVSFEETIERIVTLDPRFHRDAYAFVREALDYTQKTLTKGQKHSSHHISGQQLLDGIRQYALDQFGPMAFTVLQEWGIRSCEDFGEIVFNMVDHRLLAKTESDNRADFQNGYSFHEAFRAPFLPSKPQPQPEPQPDSTEA